MNQPHAESHPDPYITRRISDRPHGGPTVLRMLLGTQLRRIREKQGITREQAGYAIRASESKISRLELGRVSFKERDVSDLLSLYGLADEQERTTLLALARQANEPGWWHKYSQILPSWFEVYVGLEQAASRIRAYEVQFVPGLLQTEEYARAVTLLGHPKESREDTDRRVALRLARQQVLSGAGPVNLWAVVDEAALRRPIGGGAVMRRQLDHLIGIVTEHRTVVVQVLPFERGGHAAAGGPFSILRFTEPELPDVVYLEQLTSALYLDKPEETDPYLEVMERLCLEAEPAASTVAVLTRLRDDL